MKIRNAYLAAGLLVAAAATWRIINWQTMLAPNLELVTTSAVLAAVFLPRRFALAVPLTAIVVSDAVIGNSPILLFTWSAWAVIGLAALLLKPLRPRPKLLLLAGFGGAIASSLFFFAYTNFGVWLIGGLYPHTLNGLLASYVMGLPFYRTMIIGNSLLVPLGLTLALAISKVASAVDTRLPKPQS